MSTLSTDQLLHAYRVMRTIRAFENACTSSSPRARYPASSTSTPARKPPPPA